MAVQNNWRMCNLCMGIFFGGHQTKGRCPFDALPGFSSSSQHTVALDVHLQLNFAVQKRSGFQDDWRWCNKCEGLFFRGNKSGGICPAGGPHNSSASGNYHLQFALSKKVIVGVTLAEILWCAKCEGMYVNVDSNFGTCPGVGDHVKFGSGNYFIANA